MKMQKRLFRIGDLAEKLNVEKFVIRFWEKEFNVKTHRSVGGQRFYSIDDYEAFKKIKTLLYERGFTIAGAKKELCSGSHSAVGSNHGATKTTLGDARQEQFENLQSKLIATVAQLRKLRELL